MRRLVRGIRPAMAFIWRHPLYWLAPLALLLGVLWMLVQLAEEAGHSHLYPL